MKLTGQETVAELDALLDKTLDDVRLAPDRNYEITAFRHEIAGALIRIETAHHGDPCIYCGDPHDEVEAGECAHDRDLHTKR